MCCFSREVDRVENLVAAGRFHAKKKSTDKKRVIELTKTWLKVVTVLENGGLLQDFPVTT